LWILQYDGLGTYELVGVPLPWIVVCRIYHCHNINCCLWFVGFIIVIISIVVYLIIHSEKSEEIEVMSDAQKILNERYAKGEMTRKDYIQAKEDLQNFKPK